MADDDEDVRVLRSFPSGGRRSVRGASPSRPVAGAVEAFKLEAFESIWSRLVADVEPAQTVVDMNSTVFESVKDFCRGGGRDVPGRVAVGALFTGALVACHEVEPLTLLTAILREASFHVAYTLAREASSISDLLIKCLRQLKGAEIEGVVDISALVEWCTTTAAPTVLLLSEVDRMEAKILADLVTLLSRHCADLPLVVLIGVSKDAGLDCLLPSYLRSAVRCQPFSMMSPRQCFEHVLQKMLLSASVPALVLGGRVMEVLNDVYLYHHFTIKSFKALLKQAVLEHVTQTQLGALLRYMSDEQTGRVAGQIEALPDAFWGAMSPMRISALPQLMRCALEKVCGFKTTVLWLHYAAEALGTITRNSGHSLREIYTSALYPDFLANFKIPNVEQWEGGEGQLTTKLGRLTELVVRMQEVSSSFSRWNLQLRGITERLGRLQGKLEAAQERPTKNRTCSQDVPPSAEDLAVLKDGAREVDEMLYSMAEMYCGQPPEQQPGHQLHCVNSDAFMRQNLMAAPRLQVPTSIRYDAATTEAADLIKDAAVVYQLCLEMVGCELQILEGLSLFAGRYGVTLSPTATLVSDASDDSGQNDSVSIGSLRARYEWALRALEEVGLIRRRIRGEALVVRLEIFNESCLT